LKMDLSVENPVIVFDDRIFHNWNGICASSVDTRVGGWISVTEG